MIKLNIKDLQKVLQKAEESGCEQVKLQLYDTWDDIERERKTPALPPQDYNFDVRYYNTVEFAQEIEGNVATDKLRISVADKLLILHVEISDMETLLKGFGLEEE